MLYTFIKISNLINNFYISIINYKIVNKSNFIKNYLQFETN